MSWVHCFCQYRSNNAHFRFLGVLFLSLQKAVCTFQFFSALHWQQVQLHLCHFLTPGCTSLASSVQTETVHFPVSECTSLASYVQIQNVHFPIHGALRWSVQLQQCIISIFWVYFSCQFRKQCALSTYWVHFSGQFRSSNVDFPIHDAHYKNSLQCSGHIEVKIFQHDYAESEHTNH